MSKEKLEKIIVKKQIAEKDYRYAIYFNVLLRSRAMPFILAALGVISIGEIVYCFVTGITGHFNYMLLSAVLILAIDVYILFRTENAAKKAAKRVQNIAGEERTVIFSEEEVVTEGTDGGEFISMDWDTLSKAYELKNYFIVYFTAPRTIIVPKEYMDYDQMRDLTKMLQKKAPGNFINRA